jgi:UMF1 family MFS transporter
MAEHHLDQKQKTGIIAWCTFDWANSAFPTLVVTFVFAPYFTEHVAHNNIIGTQQWGNTIALSAFLIAILSPLFGAIADNRGRRKPWLGFFVCLTIIASFLLWYTESSPQATYWILSCVLFGYLGFAVGTVFYNAMLSDLVPRHYVGRISGWAWGLGYIGGLACLGVALVLFINNGEAFFQLDPTKKEHIRICGPLVAVWLGLFSLPLFFCSPDRPDTGRSLGEATKKGIVLLGQTIKSLSQHKNILYFLIANMLYMDGVNTIFAFGSIYAAGTFGFTFDQVIILGIVMNIAAACGAAVFAFMDDFVGAKATILTTLLMMIVGTAGLVVTTSDLGFWLFALLVSFAVGPVQAASRSLMVRLAPRDIATEMFGLFALSGRATTFLGPWLAGMATVHFGSQRFGVAMILLFLVLGPLTLFLVREPSGRPKLIMETQSVNA